MSTPLVIVKAEYWIRVNLAIEYCVKGVLISTLHNLDNDPSYHGLPTDPKQFYQEMLKCKNNLKHKLHKVFKADQWDILCPPNQQETNFKDLDITILVALIRSVIGLKPKGGWMIQCVQPNDTSKGAFVFLALKLRNEIKHGTMEDIQDLNTFQNYWQRIRDILIGLHYKNMASFDLLETCPLDKHIDIIMKLINDLEKRVDVLSNEASDNTSDIRNLNKDIQSINILLTKMMNEKADKSELVNKADKSELVNKADKNELINKADKSELVNKADKNELINKADKSELVNKADKSELVNKADKSELVNKADKSELVNKACLLYTSPSPRDS